MYIFHFMRVFYIHIYSLQQSKFIYLVFLVRSYKLFEKKLKKKTNFFSYISMIQLKLWSPLVSGGCYYKCCWHQQTSCSNHFHPKGCSREEMEVINKVLQTDCAFINLHLNTSLQWLWNLRKKIYKLWQKINKLATIFTWNHNKFHIFSKMSALSTMCFMMLKICNLPFVV